MTCLLFLTMEEKASLGAFVKSPFKTYHKIKEKMDMHETTEYHKRALERGLCIKSQIQNLTKRIDVQINTVANENMKTNEAILPLIVNTVRLCAKQQIPLRGHREDKINYSEQPSENEGNFIALIRLLAESNIDIKKSP